MIGFHMNPFSVGSLHTQMRQQTLYQKFEQRKENPNLEKSDEEKTKRERDLERIRQEAFQIREGNQISALDGKIKAGGELTDQELEYLKQKNPELYKKAVEAKAERERYKKELKACKTKEDVEKLNARKTQEFMAEIKAVKSNPNIPEGKKQEIIEQIGRRFMGVMAEHSKFISSKDYQELPTEEEKKEKKKKTTTDSEPSKEMMDLSGIQSQIKEELLLLDAGFATETTGTGYTADVGETYPNQPIPPQTGTTIDQKI